MRYQPFTTEPAIAWQYQKRREKNTRSEHECEHEDKHHCTNTHTHTQHDYTQHDRTELREILLEVINLLKANQDTTNQRWMDLLFFFFNMFFSSFFFFVTLLQLLAHSNCLFPMFICSNGFVRPRALARSYTAKSSHSQ